MAEPIWPWLVTGAAFLALIAGMWLDGRDTFNYREDSDDGDQG